MKPQPSTSQFSKISSHHLDALLVPWLAIHDFQEKLQDWLLWENWYLWYLGLSPLPGCWLVTTRMIWTIFRIGDPELNLHLPQLLGGGTTQMMSIDIYGIHSSSCEMDMKMMSTVARNAFLFTWIMINLRYLLQVTRVSGPLITKELQIVWQALRYSKGPSWTKLPSWMIHIQRPGKNVETRIFKTLISE